MQKLIVLVLTIAMTLFLSSCAHQDGMRVHTQNDLLTENWMSHMNVDPMRWIPPSDRWFFTGEPTGRNRDTLPTPVSAAISDMRVRVPNFTTLIVDGDFTVQVTGQQLRNSVEMIGPNSAVRGIAVETYGDTLYLHRTGDCKTNLHDVIIRIGVNTLTKLINKGNGTVLGRSITSDRLLIAAHSNGHIILCGVMRVTNVIATDTATVTVIGVHSSDTDITTMNQATVNLSGRIGIHHIVNEGGFINIIGADSNELFLCTKGCSVTKIAGYAAIKEIVASENSRIEMYWVVGRNTNITLWDHARVNLAGCIADLTIHLAGASRFDGQNLHTLNAYATTSGSSHANIEADEKLFASTSGSSSIYYFGAPGNVSRFLSGNSTIIPVYTNGIAIPPTPYHQPDTWNFRTGG